MNYDLNKLNSADFEILTQSLLRKILGNGTISFGKGPDGGREATFEGKADYPGKLDPWDGYWVMQAKFKDVKTLEQAKDFNWLSTEIHKEMKKYDDRKVKVKKPDNLLLFTNIVLTPVVVSGGRDQISKLIQRVKQQYSIKNMAVISYDDIVDYLNNYRDIAVAFSGFILPGDILNKLLDLLNKGETEKKKVKEFVARYLENEFLNSINSKLEHAGKLTDEKINLEKVFIDLYATPNGGEPDTDEKRFIARTIEKANLLLKPSLKRESRYVLIAGPGYGKSTLTQFLCQIYISHFLNNVDDSEKLLPEVKEFIEDCRETIHSELISIRLPFKIILKEYASWIKEQEEKKESVSLISYLKILMNRRCSEIFFSDTLVEEIISSTSTLFVFDGLDEVPSSSNRKEVIDSINYFTDVLLRRLDADSLIVGTSRPQGYTKEFDSSRYAHLMITDLNNSDCLVYIEKLLKNIETDESKRNNDFQILSIASNDSIVSRLMKSPLQASIMTILVRSGGEPPRNKFELFTEYYRTIFKREKQKNVSKILNQNQDYIDDIHYRLGFELQLLSETNSNPSAIILIEDFKIFIKNYLSKEVELTEKESDLVTQSIIDAATNRLVFIEEVQDGKIGFNIRSIQEFFAANYYMNTPDEEILQRLRFISESSYWSNTLMFSVGNLFKNRKHALNHVEAICNELNGSSDSYEQLSLSSLINKGSWLSLDILNEAIFRGHPKYENRYSRMLKKLFEIPFIPSHIDISRLPENIKTDWVINFIKEFLESSSSSNRITALCVLSSLFKEQHENSYMDLIAEVSFNNDEWMSLVKTVVDNKIAGSQIGVNLLIKALLQADLFEYVEIISELDENIVLKVLRNTNDEKVKSIIFSSTLPNLLYKSFNVEDDDYVIFYELYRKISNDKDVSNMVRYFSNRFDGRIEFSIIEPYYSGSINSLYDKNLDQLQLLKNAALYYRVDYIVHLAEFYLNPSKIGLYTLAQSLINHPHSKFIIDLLSYMNWVFYKVFNDNSDSLLEKIENGNFGDEVTWERDESMFKEKCSDKSELPFLLSLSQSRTWTSDKSPEIIKSILDMARLENSGHVPIEILKILSWHSRTSYRQIKNIIESDRAYELIIIDSLKQSVSGGLLTPNYIIVSISFISIEQLIESYDEIDKICKNVIPDFTTKRYFINNESLYDALNKAVKLYSSFITPNFYPSILNIIPAILHTNFGLNAFITDVEVPINVSYAKVLTEEQFGSIALVLLLTLNKESRHLKTLEGIISTKLFSSDIIKMMLHVIENFNIQKNLDSIFPLFGPRLTNYQDYSNFLRILKSYLEAKPSKIPISYI